MNGNFKLRFMQKHYSGTYILMLTIFRLSFSWFTDCGDWFVYISIRKANGKSSYVRFSSAGFMTGR